LRRRVWSRNPKNEEAMTRAGSQRHSKKKKSYWLSNRATNQQTNQTNQQPK